MQTIQTGMVAKLWAFWEIRCHDLKCKDFQAKEMSDTLLFSVRNVNEFRLTV